MSAWFGIAEGDAREWFRDHQGVPLEEFDDWVCRYECQVLSWTEYSGGRFGLKLNEILDDVHTGLQQALVDERRRRAASHRVDAVA